MDERPSADVRGFHFLTAEVCGDVPAKKSPFPDPRETVVFPVSSVTTWTQTESKSLRVASHQTCGVQVAFAIDSDLSTEKKSPRELWDAVKPAERREIL